MTSGTLGRLRIAFDIGHELDGARVWPPSRVRVGQSTVELRRPRRWACAALLQHSFMEGTSLGISCISLSTKPYSEANGGNAFSSLTYICKTHMCTYINTYVCVCFKVAASSEYEHCFKSGIVLSFINTYETGLLKLLWSVAHKFLEAWFSFSLFAFKSWFAT